MTIQLDATRQRILDTEGHLLVLGGPGSGKTTIALLKAKKLCQWLLPEQRVLFLSFSRAAVKQVSKRSADLLSQSERRQIEVNTYHAFCLDFLRSHGRLLTRKPVKIVYPSNARVLEADFGGPNWRTEQERLLAEESRATFDVFAHGVSTLLERCRALRCLVSNRYPIIIVDEFQDTDDDQWRMVHALRDHATLICLADPDQRIFDYQSTIDPKRVEMSKDALAPTVFDLGADNHRSPGGRILDFANAVLRNRSPKAPCKEVTVSTCYENAFPSTVHAEVVFTFSKLRQQGVENPTVVVLARSNPLVATISSILSETHQYNRRELRPIFHTVVWDAEVAAAAGTVIASVMEWREGTISEDVARTFEALAAYYRLKVALRPDKSKGAADKARKYRESADRVRAERSPRLNVERALLTCWREKKELLRGDPVEDWRRSRDVLDRSSLPDIVQESRMLRLFRMTDELGLGLADRWDEVGRCYPGAKLFVSRTLETQRLLAPDLEPRGCVLMSMHKSKGKEFDGVVIAERQHAGVLFDPKKEEPPFESTRRLLRVAITRARHRVTIVRPKNCYPLY
ncbi:MAG: ATP-dependent helicase [Pseudomonadota bacterium]